MVLHSLGLSVFALVLVLALALVLVLVLVLVVASVLVLVLVITIWSMKVGDGKRVCLTSLTNVDTSVSRSLFYGCLGIVLSWLVLVLIVY